MGIQYLVDSLFDCTRVKQSLFDCTRNQRGSGEHAPLEI